MGEIPHLIGIAIAGTPFFSPNVQASDFSFSIGPQKKLFRGWIKYKGNEIDVKDDLHLDDKTKFSASAKRRLQEREAFLSKNITFGKQIK